MRMSWQEDQGIRAMRVDNTPQTAQTEESSTSIAACSEKFADLSTIQEVEAEGPLSTSPTHPNSKCKARILHVHDS